MYQTISSGRYSGCNGRATRISALEQVQVRIAGLEGAVAGLARLLAARCRELTAQINELTALICAQAPALIAIFGCGTLTAAKILGETVGVDRFRSKDRLSPP
jgi:transposase